MPAFPATGKLLFEGYAENPEAGVNRTPFEDGFTKQSQVSTRQLVRRPVKYLFTSKADYEGFLTWYRVEIARAGFFDWTDPRDNVVKQARIVGGEIAAQPTRKALDRWIVAFDIETWGF